MLYSIILCASTTYCLKQKPILFFPQGGDGGHEDEEQMSIHFCHYDKLCN